MYDRIKGFRDFYPGEMAARRETIDTVEEFYESCGYETVSDVFDEAGIPHVKMETRLDSRRE